MMLGMSMCRQDKQAWHFPSKVGEEMDPAWAGAEEAEQHPAWMNHMKGGVHQVGCLGLTLSESMCRQDKQEWHFPSEVGEEMESSMGRR